MIDLDVAARLLAPELERWRDVLDVAVPTWRERCAPWRKPLETLRESVRDPESCVGQTVVTGAPVLADVPAAVDLVVRTVTEWIDRVDPA